MTQSSQQNNSNQKKKNKTLGLVVRLVVTISLLIFLGATADLSELWQLIIDINIYWLVAAAALIAGERVLMAMRWQYTLAVQGVKVGVKELSRILYVAMFFAHFLPGGLVGADVLRGYELARSRGHVADVTATLILDRFIGVFSMFTMAFVGAIVGGILFGTSIAVIIELIVLQALILGGWLLAGKLLPHIKKKSLFQGTKIEKIWNKLLFILEIITDLDKIKSIFVKLFTLSMIVQLSRSVTFFCLYKSLGATVPFTYFMIFIPIVFISLMLPISLGGLGVREGTLVYSFATLGVAPEVSIGSGILSHFLQIIVSLPAVFHWIFNRDKPVEEVPSVNQLNASP